MALMGDFYLGTGVFYANFIIMAVVGNFYFSTFLRLMWKFLGLESERGCSVCWPNNKIVDVTVVPWC